MSAQELFAVYEAAYPDPNLRRTWPELTLIERTQWDAVAAAVAFAYRPPEADD